MTIAYGAAGVLGYSTGNPVAAVPAGITAGQYLVILIGSKPDTATATNPAGWTDLGVMVSTSAVGTGIDVGPTRVRAYGKIADGSETAVTIVIAGNSVTWAQMLRFTKSAANLWDVGVATGEDLTGGAAFSATMTSNPGLTAGDMCLVAAVIPTDITTPAQFTAEAITATGVSVWGTMVEVSEPDSASGQDIGGFVFYRPVTTGTATAAPVVTATAAGTTTAVYGPTILIRLREKLGTSVALTGPGSLTGTGVAGPGRPFSAWLGVGERLIRTSSDGLASSTEYDNNTFWGGYGSAWSPSLHLFVAMGSPYAVAGKGGIRTSPDGEVWTERASPLVVNDSQGKVVIWVPELNLFVAGCVDAGNSKVLTSPTGIVWTVRDALFGAASLDDLAWSPSLGLLVAVGGYGAGPPNMSTSPDGINWTLQTVDFGRIMEIIWVAEKGLFYATTSGGGIITSSTGFAWTSLGGGFITNITYSPLLNIFVAFSGNTPTSLMWSYDAVNWTLAGDQEFGYVSGSGFVWDVYDIVWSALEKKFLVTGANYTGTPTQTSTDGIRWSFINSTFQGFSVAFSELQSPPALAFDFTRQVDLSGSGGLYSPVAKSPDSQGLVLWLDAGAIAATDGGDVTSWTSSDANAYVLDAKTGALAWPTYRATGGPNGLPCVDQYTGQGGMKTTSEVLGAMPSGDFTLFTVIKKNTAMAHGVIGSVDPGFMSANLGIYYRTFHTSADSAMGWGDLNLTNNTWQVLIYSVAASTGDETLTIGDVTRTTRSDPNTFLGTKGVNYGADRSGYPLYGNTAETGYYDHVLSSREKAVLTDYLNTKYFVAPAAPARTGASTLGGSGSLSFGVKTPALTGATGTLAGAGTLTTVGVPRPVQSVALSGSGTLAATGTETVAAGVSLTAAATLTAAVTVASLGAAPLVAASTLTSAGLVTDLGAASLTTAATLTVSATTTRFGAADLTATGTLTTAGTRGSPGAAGLLAAATLTSAAFVTTLPTVTLTGASTLTTAGTRSAVGVVALVASTSLTAAGVGTVLPAAALTSSSTLTAAADVTAGFSILYGDATLVATSVLATVGTLGRSAAG
ncbi:MAG: hypothetical protein ACOH10_07680, partial [Rhodoglobus sp.]